MARVQVSRRDATLDDVAVLSQIWAGAVRSGDPSSVQSDMAGVLRRVAAAPDERIVVAEIDGHVVGAVHLQATTLTAINVEPVVRIVSPHVLARYRRLGIGYALMEAGVIWAEELGIAHVGSAAESSGREANRFMARLSLAPMAMLRVAPTSAIRARLDARRPVHGNEAALSRHIERVLASRRTRREQVRAQG
ncbi:MAG: GNAT family N-acetyltransferase [Nocardioides sp.]